MLHSAVLFERVLLSSPFLKSTFEWKFFRRQLYVCIMKNFLHTELKMQWISVANRMSSGPLCTCNELMFRTFGRTQQKTPCALKLQRLLNRLLKYTTWIHSPATKLIEQLLTDLVWSVGQRNKANNNNNNKFKRRKKRKNPNTF